MTPRGRRWLGIAVLSALVLPLLVDWLWTTDEERLLATLERIQKALVARAADRVLAECAAEVRLEAPVPGFEAQAAFADALAKLLKRLDELRLERETTELALQDGVAHVHCRGYGFVRTQGSGGPFRFDVEAEFERGAERRFALTRVKRVRIEPGPP